MWKEPSFIVTKQQVITGVVQEVLGRGSGTLKATLPRTHCRHSHAQVPRSRLLRKWPLSHSFFRRAQSHILPSPSGRSPVNCFSECGPRASRGGFPFSERRVYRALLSGHTTGDPYPGAGTLRITISRWQTVPLFKVSLWNAEEYG
jgi:hypothetical protein